MQTRIRAALIVALSVLTAAPALGQQFPQTFPANTVFGRLGITAGPGQAIPFSVFAARIGPGVIAVIGTVNGILKADGAGHITGATAGVDYQVPSANLTALLALSGTGFPVRTATNVWAQRNIVGTANRLTVTNGDGIAGNPALDISAAYIGQSSITTLGTITAGTWTGTPVAIANGGCGATTAADCRTALGLGTMATQAAGAVAITGGTITGMSNPTTGSDVANKTYVDLFSGGLRIGTAVTLATTANLTLSGEQTIDGVLTSATRILVKNQTAPAENGVYVTGAGAWTRATDFDTSGEMLGGTTFLVTGGSVNIGSGWALQTTVATVGTSAVNFAQYTSLSGVLLAANNFSDINNASTARTNLGVAIGTNVQAFDSDLSALAANTGNGLWARTSTGTGSARTLTGSAGQITVTNGDGVSGNPTFTFPAAMSGSGITWTGGTFASVTHSGGTAFPGSTIIDSSGNIGVGVVPAVPVDIGANSTSLGLNIRGRTSDSLGALRFSSHDGSTQTGAISADTSGNLHIFPLGTERLTILGATGNVGVATTTPSETLDVNGTFRVRTNTCSGLGGFATWSATGVAGCAAGSGTGVGGTGGTLCQVLVKYDSSDGHANWFTPETCNIATVPGVDCSGATASDTAFATAFSGFPNVLVPPGCTIKLSMPVSNYTIGVGSKLTIACGGAISVDSTKTLTINGQFPDPGPCLSAVMFPGAGSVVGIASVRCEWWGCSTAASGATNSTAINKAIASVQSSGSSVASEHKITFQCALYNIASMITLDLSAIDNWTVQGCGGNSVGFNRTQFIAAASFTGGAAFWFNGAGAIPNITVSGIALLNDTAGSGPTYGILVGPTGAACCMNGYHNNLFTDINVSGFNTNIRQQNARLFKYDRISIGVGDVHGTEAINTVQFECYASANSFCGDTELVDSQITGHLIPRATYTGSISGTTLTVSGVSGVIAIGQGVSGDCCSLGVLPGTVITGGSGTTWTINQSQTVSSRGMHASQTGTNVLLTDGGNAAGVVAGIRFTNFISYFSATQLSLSQTGAGGRIGDIWEKPGVQHEGADGNGSMVVATASAGSIDDIHFDGVYGAGLGFSSHFKASVASGASVKSWKITNNFLSNFARESIKFIGTGGFCLDININGNTFRSPGTADGVADSVIYFENCGRSNVVNNIVHDASPTYRPSLFKLNVGGDHITCMSNNSGGFISGSICDNAAGIGTFKIGGTDSNQ